VVIKKRTFARIGLMGNPSDGFYGKTISSCIANFHAEVTLTESRLLKIDPHETYDTADYASFYPSTEFDSLKDLEVAPNRDGYTGGIRLIYATCKRFSRYCREENITLDNRLYTIRYDTTIPRQVGLGGSSGIIVSLWGALMESYGLTDEDIPLEA